MSRDILGIIFAHEKTDAMRELTANRTVASLPFGGRYRMIDFTLSCMVASNIKDIGVVTRSDYYSLMEHLGTGKEWDLNRKKGGLSILPPSIGDEGGFFDWNSKISILMGIIDYVRSSGAKYVLLTDANILANVDYTDFLKFHIEKQAYLTAMYKPYVYDHEKFRGNTFADVDKDGRIRDVAISQNIQLHSNMLLGTYVIERELLEFLICQCVSHNKCDFERDIVQKMADSLDIYGYEYNGYVEKIDSVNTFFKANFDLLHSEIRHELFCDEREIVTKVHDEVPSKFCENAVVKNCLIADGCVIDGLVENSVIFRNVVIEKGARVKNCVIMQGGAIGEGAELEFCITDRFVNVSKDARVCGAKSYPIVLPKGSKI